MYTDFLKIAYTPQLAHKKIGRCSDVVLFPPAMQLLLDPQKSAMMQDESTLKTEVLELANFASSTIRLLVNQGKKVCPKPMLPFQVDGSQPSFYRHFELDVCKQQLLSEIQFSPTFHLVGHGTPNWIGTLMQGFQHSPIDCANMLDKLFRDHSMDSLRSRQVTFVFHTCNGAYVNIYEKMCKQEILAKIAQESFIGQFYRQMSNLGYTNHRVIGYRGYYSSMTSKNTSEALVQDRFIDPVRTLIAQKGEYSIYKGQCIPTNQSDAFLTFPVDVDVDDMVVEYTPMPGI